MLMAGTSPAMLVEIKTIESHGNQDTPHVPSLL